MAGLDGRRRDVRARQQGQRSLLAVLLLGVLVFNGCGALSGALSHIAVWGPVWMPDGWVYYLRDEQAQGAELWRQREGAEGEFFKDVDDVSSDCDRASFTSLFRASRSGLGIALTCGGEPYVLGQTPGEVEYSRLIEYSTERAEFRLIASTSFVGGSIALSSDHSSGYAELGTNCGVGIMALRDGELQRIPSPIRLNGRTWLLDGEPRGASCAGVAWTQSPVLSPDEATVYLVVSPDSIGKLPESADDELDSVDWYLCAWNGEDPTPRVVSGLPGRADLAVSPSGETIVATVHNEDGDPAGVFFVDVVSGEVREVVKRVKAYDPSWSPDGSRFVYVRNLEELSYGSREAG
jgi:hypothetical protein